MPRRNRDLDTERAQMRVRRARMKKVYEAPPGTIRTTIVRLYAEIGIAAPPWSMRAY